MVCDAEGERADKSFDYKVWCNCAACSVCGVVQNSIAAMAAACAYVTSGFMCGFMELISCAVSWAHSLSTCGSQCP